MEGTVSNKTILEGLTITGVLITVYLVYKAIGDYQTYKRIQNIDKSLAKLAGTESYDNILLDKITFSNATQNLENRINKKGK